MNEISNKRVWERKKIVYFYKTRDYLQKPELAIFNIIKNRLKCYNMLDIGVGGGRTSLHFAPLSKKYLGIDYSEEMINACKKRFQEKDSISFRVSDIRHDFTIETNKYDFILFSYNGLDYMNHEERLNTLKKISKALKKGGFFAFSTHNIHSIKNLYSINKVRTFRQLVNFFGVILLNGLKPNIHRKNWTIINDGSHFFGLKTYYINPRTQLEQLVEINFKNFKLFSLTEGKIINGENLEQTQDPWIYYFCKK